MLAGFHSRSFTKMPEIQLANWQAVCAKQGFGVISYCKLTREEPNVVGATMQPPEGIILSLEKSRKQKYEGESWL